ncbi:RNA polymerase sigma factor [Chryseosolibacter indicus]|uniref:RNA polymerase sigma-70 region 2 domain-containing protein n=1 Tax=Chryseosolibacter indicus TaxID=2782351 RepID=A0ABS5VY34_9BACT|nr:hypothetical protein [Chryseosolibacter indicus]MBT1706305.1 hypothetical protein [Chryseosolibacter indicus]
MSSYKDHSDIELITLLQSGDPLAFETIYRKYAGALYTYARRSISIPEDCEEIVQDKFVLLWIRRQQLKSFQWLFNRYKFIVKGFCQCKEILSKQPVFSVDIKRQGLNSLVVKFF